MAEPFFPTIPSYLFVIDAMKKILSKTKKIPKDKQWSFGNLFFSGTNIAYNSSYESGERREERGEMREWREWRERRGENYCAFRFFSSIEK